MCEAVHGHGMLGASDLEEGTEVQCILLQAQTICEVAHADGAVVQQLLHVFKADARAIMSHGSTRHEQLMAQLGRPLRNATPSATSSASASERAGMTHGVHWPSMEAADATAFAGSVHGSWMTCGASGGQRARSAERRAYKHQDGAFGHSSDQAGRLLKKLGQLARALATLQAQGAARGGGGCP